MACGLLLAAGCDRGALTPASAPSTGPAPADAWREAVRRIEAQPARSMALRPTDAWRDNQKSVEKVIVFSDFESPACRAFAEYWDREVEPYVYQRVHYIFRCYPLNSACNPLVVQTAHTDSCRSAALAEAARRQGGNDAFWRMHDELFRNQVRPAGEKLPAAELARRCGLDPDRLERDAGSPEVRDRIIQDVSLAQQAGVTSVPTVFFNGRMMDPWDNDRVWMHFLRFEKGTVPVSLPATRPTGK
jgi:predicted DsbA family dithiol-disulfide isomerase